MQPSSGQQKCESCRTGTRSGCRSTNSRLVPVVRSNSSMSRGNRCWPTADFLSRLVFVGVPGVSAEARNAEFPNERLAHLRRWMSDGKEKKVYATGALVDPKNKVREPSSRCRGSLTPYRPTRGRPIGGTWLVHCRSTAASAVGWGTRKRAAPKCPGFRASATETLTKLSRGLAIQMRDV